MQDPRDAIVGEAGHPVELPGLRNVVEFHEGYLSGSVPEGEVGFGTLANLGVRTIISVDGGVPSVDLAEAHGIRYIHLPVGYGGIDRERSFELACATRESIQDGSVYVHCHHGKHRSSAVAGVVTVMLGWQTSESALEKMRIAGTSPKYTGLFDSVADAEHVEGSLLDLDVDDFPSVWQPSSFVHGMIEMDDVLDRLRLIEQAGWSTPVDHPDLVPVAEAGQMADLHRLLVTEAREGEQPAEFASGFDPGLSAARDLEDQLLLLEPDHARMSDWLDAIADSCVACHDRYRVVESIVLVD